MNPNDSKVALITGGAHRVGKDISTTLHQKGYRIVVHFNSSANEAYDMKEELNALREDSIEVLCENLSEEVEVTAKRLVDKAVNKWGRLDLVVNNASVFHSSTLQQLTCYEWDNSIDVNLKAPVFIMQAAARYLKATKGSIVNISDLIGLKPKSSHFSHLISKAGLISATESAALNLAPEVRVNAIAPGVVLWPEVDPDFFTTEERKLSLERTPMKRFGCPKDVADAVVFLASPEANFITGQTIKIDGGRGLVF